ncbi:MAG: TetR/AcrR family transcriptional regulator [Actinomycetota bacterium]
MTAAPSDHLTDKGRRTRERLLEVAGLELLDHGVVEVTAVAERAGVSVGLLYRYFANKDGLITALIDEFYDQYEAVVLAEAPPADVHWTEFERARIVREVGFVFDHPLGRAIIGGPPAEPAAALADGRRLGRHIEMAARNIAHGVRRGEIDVSVDHRLAGAAIIGGLRSCLAMALANGNDISRNDVVEAVEQASAGLIRPN